MSPTVGLGRRRGKYLGDDRLSEQEKVFSCLLPTGHPTSQSEEGVIGQVCFQKGRMAAPSLLLSYKLGSDPLVPQTAELCPWPELVNQLP